MNMTRVLLVLHRVLESADSQGNGCDLAKQVRGITVQHHSKHRSKTEDTECLMINREESEESRMHQARNRGHAFCSLIHRDLT